MEEAIRSIYSSIAAAPLWGVCLITIFSCINWVMALMFALKEEEDKDSS